MKLKKIAALALASVLSASLLTGCANDKKSEVKDDQLTIGMITDVAGVNDQSFNQSAWEGLKKAEKELGVKVKYLESKQDSDYAANIETLSDEGVDLILGVGMKLAPAIEEGSKLYPEQKFALVDETYPKVPENVKAIQFNSQESAYLSGLVAGKMTKTNNIGFIGGMQLPVIEAYQYGYMAGAKAVNPNLEVQVQYANSFTDQAKGKAIANQMYSKGADIIFTAGGDVGTGAIEAAKEQGKFAIGVDRDQSSLALDNVLTSAIKRVDVGVFDTVKELVDGKFQGGTTAIYGLKEGAVGIPDTTKNLVSKDIIDYVNTQADKFEKGELKAPKNEKEYKEMVK